MQKVLSFALDKNFIGVNHIEGHIFSGFLMNEKPYFPLFMFSRFWWAHTSITCKKFYRNLQTWDSTVDDAAGKAFDKVAKLLGLGYPGGPKIQIAASKGDGDKIDFPVSDLKQKLNFSFQRVKNCCASLCSISRWS